MRNLKEFKGGVTMVFDPITLCWVDERDMHNSSESSGHYYIPHRAVRNRCEPSCIRNEPLPYIGNRAGFWEAALGKLKDFVPMLGGLLLGVGVVYGLNWLDDKYSICARAKAYFSGASEVATMNESEAHYDRELWQEVSASPTTWTIICCVCSSRLDASHLRHLRSFDCSCPNCGSNLHVETQN